MSELEGFSDHRMLGLEYKISVKKGTLEHRTLESGNLELKGPLELGMSEPKRHLEPEILELRGNS